jgi:uncharacterized repeat protein (TIGR02543 family)
LSGGYVGLPGNPTKAGHTFGGWYTAQNGNGTPFTATTPVNADMTVYAKWTTYPVVTFDADGGTFANGETTSTASCPAGATVVSPPSLNPRKPNYDFFGWYTAQNGNGTQFTATTPVNADITVYAKWTPYPVVTFDGDGVRFEWNGWIDTTTTMSCPAGTTVVPPSIYARIDPYDFGGWYTEPNGGGTEFTASTLVTENITVYAKWMCYVTFNADGGEPGTSTATCTPGESVALPSSNPTRTGYVFGGWYTAQNGGGVQFTATTPVNANRTVYAWWISAADAVTVTFNAYGGTFANGETTSTASCPAGGTVTPPTTPTRTGYYFAGWFTDQYGNATQFGTSTLVTEDMTLYAIWSSNQAYLILDMDGGLLLSMFPLYRFPVNGVNISEYTSLVTRTGYTFGGWFTERNGGGTQVTEITLDDSITLYAKWIPE